MLPICHNYCICVHPLIPEHCHILMFTYWFVCVCVCVCAYHYAVILMPSALRIELSSCPLKMFYSTYNSKPYQPSVHSNPMQGNIKHVHIPSYLFILNYFHYHPLSLQTCPHIPLSYNPSTMRCIFCQLL